MKLCVVVIVGYLSFGPALPIAANNRVLGRTAYNIVLDKQYGCFLGVPYGNHKLIGKSLYFRDKQHIYGPWLVVDIESTKHAGRMSKARLAADLFCFDNKNNSKLVHSHGKLIYCEDDNFPLRWWYNKVILN